MVDDGVSVDLLEVAEDGHIFLRAIFAVSVFEVRVLCVLAIFVLFFSAKSEALDGVLLCICRCVSHTMQVVERTLNLPSPFLRCLTKNFNLYIFLSSLKSSDLV